MKQHRPCAGAAFVGYEEQRRRNETFLLSLPAR